MSIYKDDSGAIFSTNRDCRYTLWRIWDRSLPLVAFVGLNPSTANEVDADPTIRSVGRIARHNGYGGVVMINCFPYVSADPNFINRDMGLYENDTYLKLAKATCQDVVFAWGTFAIVKTTGTDGHMTRMFPDAKCLHINKDGSPKHPLYCKSTSPLIPWRP